VFSVTSVEAFWPMTQRKRIPELKPRKVAREPHPADAELFRRAVADATPLPARNEVKHGKPRPQPRKRPQHHTEHDLSDYLPYTHEPGQPLKFNRPGVQQHVVRGLRRRGASVHAELDLHGFTIAAARRELVSFLNACARSGLRCVRIVHGKGLRSATGEGVLKGMVASWLAQRPDVLAFHEAAAAEGGSGAVVVLLRSSNR
jgi:DNA-nicking Smr family endonuclease